MSAVAACRRRSSRLLVPLAVGIVTVIGAAGAGADHVTVHDQCAGPQDGQAVVALSLSLPAGSTIEGILYGETGQRQAAGTVGSNGIAELRFGSAEPGAFYEWVVNDAAQPDHAIASGGLDASGPPCSGSQLQQAPTTTAPPPSTTAPPPTTEPPTTTTAPPAAGPVQSATPQPVLPPPTPAAVVAAPDTTAGDVTVALPPIIDGAGPGFGGDTETSVVAITADDLEPAVVIPVAVTDDGIDPLDWFAFLVATLVVLWLAWLAGAPRPSLPPLTAARLISKQRPPD